MDGELQQRLMPLFHYALDAGGYLFLGTSETRRRRRRPVRRRRQEVEALPAPRPARRGAPSATSTVPGPPCAAAPAGAERDRPGQRRAARARWPSARCSSATRRPASIVNAEGDVLYIHGRTGRYLEPAAGEASGSSSTWPAQGLQARARRRPAQGPGAATTRSATSGCGCRPNGDIALVDLIVEPIDGPDVAKGIFLVLFEEAPEPRREPPTIAADPASTSSASPTSSASSTAKEEYLRTTVEELETSNEELKSTNEELQSTNEELQSTNEELETSKEELQSVNEELITVNAELQQKIEELSRPTTT